MFVDAGELCWKVLIIHNFMLPIISLFIYTLFSGYVLYRQE